MFVFLKDFPTNTKKGRENIYLLKYNFSVKKHFNKNPTIWTTPQNGNNIQIQRDESQVNKDEND